MSAAWLASILVTSSSPSSPWAGTAPAASASEGARAPDATLDDADPGGRPYREFIASGQGETLLAIARRIFAETAGVAESFPGDFPSSSDRLAGPRDEPPPPEWPAGPTALVLCLKVDGEVRACEGSVAGADEDLASAVSSLAARLPGSASRGRPRSLRASQLPRASLDAAFIPDSKPPLLEPASNKVALPGGVDPSQVGFLAVGAKEVIFVTLPGEAKTMKAALKLSRRAGLPDDAGAGTALRWYSPRWIGAVPLVSP